MKIEIKSIIEDITKCRKQYDFELTKPLEIIRKYSKIPKLT